MKIKLIFNDGISYITNLGETWRIQANQNPLEFLAQCKKEGMEITLNDEQKGTSIDKNMADLKIYREEVRMMAGKKLNKDGTVSKQGQNGGQPMKWNNPEELEKFIEEYYVWAKNEDMRVSVTGLAWWLDTDRKSLIRYENSEEWDWLKKCSDEEKRKYSHTIKKAKRFIEMNYENSLFNRSEATGAIFTLKNNYDWADRQEIINTTEKNDMTKEQIDKQLKELGYDNK